eukprot:Em0008g742a
MSSLAYDRMSGHKYWFDKLPDNCETMGLMNLCEDCSNGPTRARTVTYHFKALIQEYLAAFHMLHLDQCDELEHQQRYGFSLVMQFLCGLQGTCELGNYESSDDDHEKSDDDSEENGQFIIQEAGYSMNNVESDDEDDVNEDDNCGNSFLCEQEGIDDENITEKDSGNNDQKTDAANKDDLDHTLVDEDEEGESNILNVNMKGEEIASPVLNNSNHEIVDDTIYYLSQKRERDSDDEDAFLRGLKKPLKRLLDSDTECSEEQEPLETSISGNSNDSSAQTTSQCEETNSMTDDDDLDKIALEITLFRVMLKFKGYRGHRYTVTPPLEGGTPPLTSPKPNSAYFALLAVCFLSSATSDAAPAVAPAANKTFEFSCETIQMSKAAGFPRSQF